MPKQVPEVSKDSYETELLEAQSYRFHQDLMRSEMCLIVYHWQKKIGTQEMGRREREQERGKSFQHAATIRGITNTAWGNVSLLEKYETLAEPIATMPAVEANSTQVVVQHLAWRHIASILSKSEELWLLSLTAERSADKEHKQPFTSLVSAKNRSKCHLELFMSPLLWHGRFLPWAILLNLNDVP